MPFQCTSIILLIYPVGLILAFYISTVGVLVRNFKKLLQEIVFASVRSQESSIMLSIIPGEL